MNYLDQHQAAQFFDMRVTEFMQTYKKRIPYVKIGGHSLRFSEADLVNFKMKIDAIAKREKGKKQISRVTALALFFVLVAAGVVAWRFFS